MGKLMTIGQLARRVAMPTSTLRYYEKVGLLEPASRSHSGYRLYDSDAEQVLTFVHRAQRIGFSLADIRHFLTAIRKDALLDETVVEIAEQRYLDVERQLVERRAMQHELGLFLRDYRRRLAEDRSSPAAGLFDRLVERVCGGHAHEPTSASSLNWLLEKAGCNLAGLDRETLVRALSGRHFHLWRTEDGYSVLIPHPDAQAEAALKAIAGVEADCHAHPTLQLSKQEEGTIFSVRGDKAFLFAEFFLALEDEAAV